MEAESGDGKIAKVCNGDLSMPDKLPDNRL